MTSRGLCNPRWAIVVVAVLVLAGCSGTSTVTGDGPAQSSATTAVEQLPPPSEPTTSLQNPTTTTTLSAPASTSPTTSTGPTTSTVPGTTTTVRESDTGATTTTTDSPPTTTGAQEPPEGENPAQTTTPQPPAEPPPAPWGEFVPQVVDVLPHDRAAFTQGLVLHEGKFYESTGLYGESSVRIVDPATGQVEKITQLEDQYFGEGLAIAGDRIVQLTWKEEVAFVWDIDTLQLRETYNYQGEGWGLCVQGDRFVMSDGSDQLTFRHLDTFAEIGRVEVRYQGDPVSQLNELECVGEYVYANVWRTNLIMIIDPENGDAIGKVEASELERQLSSRQGIDVLNGIAYNPVEEVFYLTGKLWPEIFAVQLQVSQ